MENYLDHITITPEVIVGKPCIKGTRITVDHIIMRIKQGMSPEEYVEAYPTVTVEEVLSAIEYWKQNNLNALKAGK